jgi:hypothetical protein
LIAAIALLFEVIMVELSRVEGKGKSRVVMLVRHYRVRAPRARIRLMPATCLKHQPSTRNNSTSMAPIDDAIAAIDARDSEDDSTLTEIADNFGVDQSTLGRKCKGTTTTQEAGYVL